MITQLRVLVHPDGTRVLQYYEGMGISTGGSGGGSPMGHEQDFKVLPQRGTWRDVPLEYMTAPVSNL